MNIRAALYGGRVNSFHEAVQQLRDAIALLRPGGEAPPPGVSEGWDDILRMTLDGWVEALERDVRRATSALASADEAGDEPPTDDQVAAIEECLWRLASATEKADAIVSLAFGGEPFVVVADKPSEMTMRPSRDRNKDALNRISTEAVQMLVRARAALTGERARLRRHQLMHSLAPINALADIGVFIRVHHRDGRIFGYELLRWSPERWDEGIKELTPEALFQQRIKEASRGLEALVRVIEASANALADDPMARVPQYVYFDHDTGSQATERPSPTGPPKSFEVDFLLDSTNPPVSRRVSCTSKMHPGIEITFDEGVWRVIRVEAGEEGADQLAICRLIEDD